MGHGLEKNDKMAFRMKSGLPWHFEETGADGRAVPIPGHGQITAEQMMEAAGHGWDVKLEPVYYWAGAGEDSDDPGAARTQRLMPVPRHYAVVRDDDQSALGVVGERYEPLQNREAYQLLEELMGAGNLDYETAGSLFGGRKVWMLARLRREIVPFGPVRLQPFILLSTGHDGNHPIRVRFTTVNVVCNNTLTAALGEDQVEFTVRHTSSSLSVEEMADRAREVLGLAEEAFDQLGREVAVLGLVPFSREDMQAFARILVAPTVKDDDGNLTHSSRAMKVIEFLEDAFLTSPGVGEEGVRGTAWAALQAVTYYTTHVVTARVTSARQAAAGEGGGLEEEAHLDSVLFGTNERLATRARRILLDIAREQGVLVEGDDD